MSYLGEYWITGPGEIWYADGDISDYNHEGFALQHARYLLCDALGIDSEAAERYEINDIVKKFLENEGICDNEASSFDDQLEAWMAVNMPGDTHLVDPAFNNVVDIREHAMRAWNWKWVRGTHCSTYALRREDFDLIAEGFGEIFSPEDDEEELEQRELLLIIQVMDTGERYSLTFADLEDRNYSALGKIGLEMIASFGKSIDSVDKDSMPPCYKRQLGD